jgi:type VI secretion system secreted protein Hcp
MKSLLRKLVILPVALLALAAVSRADSYFLTVVGQKSGQIKGGVTQKGREDQIQVLEVSHSIVSPRDPASGLPTGKRMHKPFTVSILADRAYPILYSALCTNENLKSVILKAWQLPISPTTGVTNEVQAYTITLTNASIASIEMELGKDPITGQTKSQLVVSFTYQRIEWVWTSGGITAMDDWQSRL